MSVLKSLVLALAAAAVLTGPAAAAPEVSRPKASDLILPAPRPSALTAQDRAYLASDMRAIRAAAEISGVTDNRTHSFRLDDSRPTYAVQPTVFWMFEKVENQDVTVKMTVLKKAEAEQLFAKIKGASLFSTWMPGPDEAQLKPWSDATDDDWPETTSLLLQADGVLSATLNMQGAFPDRDGVVDGPYATSRVEIVLVDTGAGIKRYAFDPARFDHPVPLPDWIARLMANPQVQIGQAILQNGMSLTAKRPIDQSSIIAGRIESLSNHSRFMCRKSEQAHKRNPKLACTPNLLVADAAAGPAEVGYHRPKAANLYQPAPRPSGLTPAEQAYFDEYKGLILGTLQFSGGEDNFYRTPAMNAMREVYAVPRSLFDDYIDQSGQDFDVKMSVLLLADANREFGKIKGANAVINLNPKPGESQLKPWTDAYSDAWENTTSALLHADGVLYGEYVVLGKFYKVQGKDLGDQSSAYATAILVDTGSGIVRYVLDPGRFDRPVPLAEWNAALLKDPRTRIAHAYLQNPISDDMNRSPSDRTSGAQSTISALSRDSEIACRDGAAARGQDANAACVRHSLKP